MPAAVRETLNANQTRFAQALAMGCEQTQTYKHIFRTEGLSEAAIRVRASKLANNPHIKACAKQFVEALTISGIDNANQFLIDLLGDIRRCREEKRYTALAAFQRLRGQVLGVLKENVVHSPEQELSNAELVKRLAGKDKTKEAMFASILGTENGFKT